MKNRKVVSQFKPYPSAMYTVLSELSYKDNNNNNNNNNNINNNNNNNNIKVFPQ